jgi:hypothetical protein
LRARGVEARDAIGRPDRGLKPRRRTAGAPPGLPPEGREKQNRRERREAAERAEIARRPCLWSPRFSGFSAVKFSRALRAQDPLRGRRTASRALGLGRSPRPSSPRRGPDKVDARPTTEPQSSALVHDPVYEPAPDIYRDEAWPIYRLPSLYIFSFTMDLEGIAPLDCDSCVKRDCVTSP